MRLGGGVLGIGTDLIEVARIRRAHERYGERFLLRVYTEVERRYCLAHTNPYPSLAARFAAKEAVAKAFSCGIGAEFGWHSASVSNRSEGAPFVELDAAGQCLLQRLGGKKVLLSLTHTRELAQAFAVIVAA